MLPSSRANSAVPGRSIVIAGGGTAGHVVPAIAIARALVERGHPAGSIHFVGSRRGIEGRLVPEAGFEVTLLQGRGLARKLTPGNLVANIGAVAGLLSAIVQAIGLMARRRPSVVVSVGGYASVPCVLAAAIFRVPLVVAEQNAVPGAANRLAARVARAAAVSFAGTELPRAVVTGNPVRGEILATDRSPDGRAAARAALGIPGVPSVPGVLGDRRVVVAFGGSLGARRINQAVVGLASEWRDRSDVGIYHIVGRRDWEELAAAKPELPPAGLWYEQVPYEDRMALVYAAADVAVCRAGASTVAELTAVGLPAIVVPLPGAPGDHQTANGRALSTAGAARLIPDNEFDTHRLAVELDRLLDDGLLKDMASAARQLARPDAAVAVAHLAEEHARG
jgi:undecaprenyldiphospho-muramoylpentapeptide beta-N-acetylglucosaminyltransferase